MVMAARIALASAGDGTLDPVRWLDIGQAQRQAVGLQIDVLSARRKQLAET